MRLSPAAAAVAVCKSLSVIFLTTEFVAVSDLDFVGRAIAVRTGFDLRALQCPWRGGPCTSFRRLFDRPERIPKQAKADDVEQAHENHEESHVGFHRLIRR